MISLDLLPIMWVKTRTKQVAFSSIDIGILKGKVLDFRHDASAGPHPVDLPPTRNIEASHGIQAIHIRIRDEERPEESD